MDSFGNIALNSTTTTLGYKMYRIPPWHQPTGGIGMLLGWFHTGHLADNGANPTGRQWRVRFRVRDMNITATGTPFSASTTAFQYDLDADYIITPSGRYFLTGVVIPYTSTGTYIQIQTHRLAAANANVEFTGRIYMNASCPYSPVRKYN
jgi:hypothetical protein